MSDISISGSQQLLDINSCSKYFAPKSCSSRVSWIVSLFDKSNSLLVSVQLLLVIISFSEGKGSSSRQSVSNDDRPVPSLLGRSTLDLFFGAVASLLDYYSRSGSSSPLSSFEFAEQPFDPDLEFVAAQVVLAAAGASASSGTGIGILEGWFWNYFNTSLPNSSCSL
jgi:hypothetical protein